MKILLKFLLDLIITLGDTTWNFISDYTKTSITSISGISFGLILNVTPYDMGITFLQHASLALGCTVAIFAILNGYFKLLENIEKYKLKKQNKKKNGL